MASLEKGFNFLIYLERLLGIEPFLAFFKAYIIAFSGRSIDTSTFQRFFCDWFATHRPECEQAMSQIDWQTWLYEPGMPPVGGREAPPFQSERADKVLNLVERWTRHVQNQDIVDIFYASDMADFTALQKVLFLTNIAYVKDVKRVTVDKMDAAYCFSTSRNAEIRFRWGHLCIQVGLTDHFPALIDFITTQGRIHYVKSLYKALHQVDPELAKGTFLAHEPFYHAVCAHQIREDLQL